MKLCNYCTVLFLPSPPLHVLFPSLSGISRPPKSPLDKPSRFPYNVPVACLGAWCNGNTWVSKTFVEGSNPSAPADAQTLQDQRLQGFSLLSDLCLPVPMLFILLFTLLRLSPCLLYGCAHYVRRMLLYLFEQVRICIQCCAGPGMPQTARDFLYIATGSNQHRCPCVPEAIKRNIDHTPYLLTYRFSLPASLP